MNFRDLYAGIKVGLRTLKGRNALTFFVFLAISAVFWVLMALNDEVQKDYKVPLKLTGFPDDMTIIAGAHPTVSVTVKDKGSALMKYSWGRTPVLTVRYDDFVSPESNQLVLSQAQLNASLRNLFGAGALLQSVRPDSLAIYYTTEPGVPVRVRVDADVHTSPQAVPFGRVTLSADTVMLYSIGGKASKVKELVTAPVVLSGLTDTASVEAVLQVPAGMRAVPSTVRVTIPVEPLVSKTRRIAVEAQNLPEGTQMVTFPSMVDVTYLLPKSMYNQDSAPMKAFVKYSWDVASSKSLAVEVSQMPQYYRVVSVSPERVDYVLERD